ncbi:MAG: hypothetical protein V3U76_03305 [Granulosicoccus sp.]
MPDVGEAVGEESIELNSIAPDPDANQRRRLQLRLLAKTMAAMGVFSVFYVLFSGLGSGDDIAKAQANLQVDIADISPGEIRFLIWEGRAVLIHRRKPEHLSQLERKDERLLDARSSQSSQPIAAINDYRSLVPEWFAAIGLGTDYGCPVKELPAVDEATMTDTGEKNWQEKLWQGGFVDTCRGSRYDYAGRVYAGQFADRNLVVPDYTITGNRLILGQKSDDGQK